MKILVVEDSPLVRKMYGLAFPAREHELLTTADGREALELLAATGAVDLILLDLRMPDMDGVEFLRRLRSHPTLAALPVVLTTAEDESSALTRSARELGVAAVIRKPWKPLELRALVQRITA